nr:DUF4124 domain-containing protein [uncultured Thiodictyon sp.]
MESKHIQTGRTVALPLSQAPQPSVRFLSAAGFAVLCALTFVVSAEPAKMFRWVDENGAVHYTDQIPPNQAERGHATINNQGSRLNAVAPAKSAEELQRDAELERQRAQQAVLMEQQKAADAQLLRTYRSLDDLLMARDGKLAQFDAVIQMARGTIRRQQEWLRKLRSEAADLERGGKPVPQQLTDSLGKGERTIRESYATIVDREQEKAVIRHDFDGDIKRYRQLKGLPEDQAAASSDASRLALRNLVTCQDSAQCDLYWGRAVAYAQTHATTKIQTTNATILITAAPETPTDLGLTLSRIPDKEGAAGSIFLDLQCKNATPANTVCGAANANATKVLNEFRDVVIGTQAESAPAAGASPAAGAPAGPAPR